MAHATHASCRRHSRMSTSRGTACRPGPQPPTPRGPPTRRPSAPSLPRPHTHACVRRAAGPGPAACEDPHGPHVVVVALHPVPQLQRVQCCVGVLPIVVHNSRCGRQVYPICGGEGVTRSGGALCCRALPRRVHHVAPPRSRRAGRASAGAASRAHLAGRWQSRRCESLRGSCGPF